MSRLQPLRRRTRRTKAEMNVVPYIDVMLVLLVIFMVVAPMIQTKVLNLPSVGSASAPTEPPLVIQMNDKGELSSSGQTYASTDDMINAVRATTASKPQAVVLAADKAMAYGDVMAVMDALKKSGIERVGLLLAQATK
ncbi:TolR-like protein [Formosimonas limnophila]|uniref:TolR-like protein n=1 Tax=Formosimonas limnophila TaxID=1384487 RepID=A0A8J3FYV8_9BURK|nr:ExbD/TolR family protein [Formosimonas limnophila]GHA68765.1 TolR-like protein [Formosimonas limnophila]